MRIILTEDTGIGFEFIKMISEAALSDTIVVSSAIGSKDNRVGGYSCLVASLKRILYNKKLMSSVDEVMVLHDNFSLDYEIEPKTKEALQREIDTCREYLTMSKVKRFKIKSCACFEEAMLSFTYLMEYCDPQRVNRKSPEAYAIGIIQKEAARLSWKKKGNLAIRIDYAKLFANSGSIYEKQTTFEQRLKICLEKFTGSAKFNEFYVSSSKSVIGFCWRHDCKEHTGGKRCSICRARDIPKFGVDPKTSEGRLIILFKESLFRYLLS